VGRGLKRTVEEIRKSDKIFIWLEYFIIFKY
jgi:hypothetical protein